MANLLSLNLSEMEEREFKNRKNAKSAFFLVTVLSSLALVTAVVTHITGNISRSASTLSVIRNEFLADSVCDASFEFVKEILKDDLRRSGYDYYSEDFTNFDELWSKTFVLPVSVLYGTVNAIITDEFGKLNVNALVDSQGSSMGVAKQSYLRIFEKFFKLMGLDERFAGYLVDWIDFDTEGIFESQNSRNWFIPYPEELLEIARLIELDISKLFVEYYEGRPDATSSPYITFWPYAGAIRINVNTAPPEVISAILDKEESNDIAERIVQERKNKHFNSFSEFMNFLSKYVPIVKESFYGISPELIFDVRSEVFSIRLICEVSGVKTELQAVIMRGSSPEEEVKTIFFRRI